MILFLRNTEGDGPFPTRAPGIAESVFARLTTDKNWVGVAKLVGGSPWCGAIYVGTTVEDTSLVWSKKEWKEKPLMLSLGKHGGNPTTEVKMLLATFDSVFKVETLYLRQC